MSELKWNSDVLGSAYGNEPELLQLHSSWNKTNHMVPKEVTSESVIYLTPNEKETEYRRSEPTLSEHGDHGTLSTRVAHAVSRTLRQSYFLLPLRTSICDFAAILDKGYMGTPLTVLLPKELDSQTDEHNTKEILDSLTSSLMSKGVLLVLPTAGNGSAGGPLARSGAKNVVRVTQGYGELAPRNADFLVNRVKTCHSKSNGECVKESGSSVAAAEFAASAALLLRVSRKLNKDPRAAAEKVLSCLYKGRARNLSAIRDSALSCVMEGKQ
jgi:hypothetical protein